SPQGFGFQISTPVGGVGLGVSNSQPQLTTQGFDLGSLLSQVAPIAIQAVLSALAAAPQPVKPQSASPQIVPQGIDLGSVLSQVVPIAMQAVLNTLAASPQSHARVN